MQVATVDDTRQLKEYLLGVRSVSAAAPRQILVVEFQKFHHEVLQWNLSRSTMLRCLLLIDEAHHGLSDADESMTELYMTAAMNASFRVLFTGTPSKDMVAEFGTVRGTATMA